MTTSKIASADASDRADLRAGRPPPAGPPGLPPGLPPAWLEAAHAAADAAAAITLAGFRADLAVDDKGAGAGNAFDPVTRADRDAEAAIRDVLARRCPDIAFVGEESAGTHPTGASDGAGGTRAAGPSGHCWVVDPIDGTRAYIAGIPVWGTLVALAGPEGPVFGLLDQPYVGERFVGHAGGSSLVTRHGTRRLRTRTGRALAGAVLCATAPEMFAPGPEAEAFARVAGRAMTVRWGTDCYGYAMLAAGCVDAVVEAGLSRWDTEALIPLVTGAGGIVTDWRGGPASGSSSVVAAGSASLHAEIVDALGSMP